MPVRARSQTPVPADFMRSCGLGQHGHWRQMGRVGRK